MTTAAPAIPRANMGRLPEIDVFRGCAVGLMGMTHGLMWAFFRPDWADHIKYGGIYFCYTAFLFAFGMSLAIVAMRSGLETAAQRRRMLGRASVILLAYYVIALGRYLPSAAHGGGRALAVCVLRLVVLLDVPKAGEFLLSFVLYQVIAAAVGPHLRGMLRRPLALLVGAWGCHAIGQPLGLMAAPTALSNYWHLLFGAQPGDSRPFPIVAYLPVLAIGLVCGRAYLETPDCGRWSRGCLAAAAIVLALAAGMARFVPASSPAHWARLEPVPGFGYLLCSSALAACVFAGCALACQPGSANRSKLPAGAAWPARATQMTSGLCPGFLVYIGRNSIWVIVWQYICISASLKQVMVLRNNNMAFGLFLAAMVVAPPALLRCAQLARGTVMGWTGWKTRVNVEGAT